ncbi:hypothetical protein TruAng_009066 [Truncatella angustata]|nr:hypothetical protein TruAng_009066 [Truncatella angustata]
MAHDHIGKCNSFKERVEIITEIQDKSKDSAEVVVVELHSSNPIVDELRTIGERLRATAHEQQQQIKIFLEWTKTIKNNQSQGSRLSKEYSSTFVKSQKKRRDGLPTSD